MGGYEWTITRWSIVTRYVFFVYNVGFVSDNLVPNGGAVRPVFNLESSVTYVSGSGTMSDPVVIN